ncbi:hypothetical protein HAX54_036484 [Datura stramonium]|uniref:Pectin acetylesterase n=1 Tax=Datura stramonium TaxID=4076 RepID=A0ABS8SG31_DATST|nr:hypothetical protein [Datura stramonium]
MPSKTSSGTPNIQKTFNRVVNLHGSAKNLPPSCTCAMEPSLCFFPENVVPYVQTPLFIINSAYDAWQIFGVISSPLATLMCKLYGRITGSTIAEAVGDWYFERTGFHQLIDPYLCARD